MWVECCFGLWRNELLQESLVKEDGEQLHKSVLQDRLFQDSLTHCIHLFVAHFSHVSRLRLWRIQHGQKECDHEDLCERKVKKLIMSHCTHLNDFFTNQSIAQELHLQILEGGCIFQVAKLLKGPCEMLMIVANQFFAAFSGFITHHAIQGKYQINGRCCPDAQLEINLQREYR